jgi:hypothetical protein
MNPILPHSYQTEVKTPQAVSKAESFVAIMSPTQPGTKLWQSYKPVSIETINRMRLGVGVLPKYSSQCNTNA